MPAVRRGQRGAGPPQREQRLVVAPRAGALLEGQLVAVRAVHQASGRLGLQEVGLRWQARVRATLKGRDLGRAYLTELCIKAWTRAARITRSRTDTCWLIRGSGGNALKTLLRGCLGSR